MKKKNLQDRHTEKRTNPHSDKKFLGRGTNFLLRTGIEYFDGYPFLINQRILQESNKTEKKNK